jgi:hypothetical protein
MNLPQDWIPCSSMDVPTFLALKLKSDPLCLQMWLMVGFGSPQSWLAHCAFVSKQEPVACLASQDSRHTVNSHRSVLEWCLAISIKCRFFPVTSSKTPEPCSMMSLCVRRVLECICHLCHVPSSSHPHVHLLCHPSPAFFWRQCLLLSL